MSCSRGELPIRHLRHEGSRLSPVPVGASVDSSALLAANRARRLLRELGRAAWLSAPRLLLETAMAGLGRYPARLAAYGSLRPDEKHHDEVSRLGGRWLQGCVHGAVREVDGYPALTWDAEGPAVPVAVLESGRLGEAWGGIDRFEGEGYVRSLVPVITDRRILLAWCYLEQE